MVAGDFGGGEVVVDDVEGGGDEEVEVVFESRFAG